MRVRSHFGSSGRGFETSVSNHWTIHWAGGSHGSKESEKG